MPVTDAYANDEPPREEPAPLKSFAQSLLAFHVELGADAPFGNIIDTEEDAVVSATYSNGNIQTASPSHVALHFGFNAEIAPLRTDFMKLALRAGFLYTHIRQSAEVGGQGYESKQWSEGLFESSTALFGPVLYVGKRWYASFQALTGPTAGTLTPAPIGQAMGSIDLPDISVSGWMLRLGPGFGYAFKTLVVGGDFLYSRTSFDVESGIYPNVGGSTTLDVIGVNGHVGVHF